MRDLRCTLVCLLACVFLLSLGPTAAQAPQPPQFRAGVDLVHLDVSVLDRNRHPVRGLTAADFVVLEDGTPQAVATFAAVDYPDALPPTTAWMRDVSPDTRRNDTLDDRRLFVIVMDDGMAQADLPAVRTAKDAARQFIERLGPSDLAAVLFTKSNQHAQDYTSDKARLLKAIDRYSMGFRNMGAVDPDLPDTDSSYYRSSVEVLSQIAETLIALPQRRKTLVYIGQGVPVDPDKASTPMLIGSGLAAVGDAGEQAVLHHRTMQVLAAAQRANVNIYTIDPCGLRVPMARTCTPGLEQEFLKDLASATGGRAAVDSNELGPAVEQIFVENGSYYLLGFASTNTRREGKQRRLEVKVSRPGVEVRARSGYTEPHAERDRKAAEKDTSTPLAKAVSGLLPKGDVPLQAWAVPYAISGQRDSRVLITLGIRQTLGDRPLATHEKVDVTVDVFTATGSHRQGYSWNAVVALRPGLAGDVGYEVLSHLTLQPGRYQLRIGAFLHSSKTSGSLYYDVDVPDVTKSPVALSALALTAVPGVATAVTGAMPWLPVRPTTMRSFSGADQVQAFARVYQRGRGPVVSVPARARILDAGGREVWAISDTIATVRFINGAADLNLNLPVSQLTPGPHALFLDVGDTSQAVRFTVR
jgi:VWFA-related protein